MIAVQLIKTTFNTCSLGYHLLTHFKDQFNDTEIDNFHTCSFIKTINAFLRT